MRRSHRIATAAHASPPPSDPLPPRPPRRARSAAQITFTPKLGSQPGRPQQAMALLVPATAPALTAFAVAKASKDGVHTIALSATLIDKQLGPVVRGRWGRGGCVFGAAAVFM